MRSILKSEYEGAASLRLITSSSWLKDQTKSRLRLSAAVARGITGKFSGIADLFILSAVLIYFALWAVNRRPADDPFGLLSMRISVGHCVVLAACWAFWRTVFYYCGLYSWQHNQSAPGVVGRVFLATGPCALFSAWVIASQWHHGNLLHFMFNIWVVSALFVVLSRMSIGAIQAYVRPLFRKKRNAVIVGSSSSALRISEELKAHSDWNYTILGVIESTPAKAAEAPFRILGSIWDLEKILMCTVVDEVIVTLPLKSHYSAVERVIAICERVGVEVQYPEDLFDLSWSSHCHPADQDRPKIIFKMVPEDYRHCIKRVIDITGALFGMIVCAPLFLIVAILIKSTSKGTVLFRQERYGLGKRTFRIYKFRTMVLDAEAAQPSLEHMNQNSGPVFKIFDDPRVTRVGAFLRKTSIDELPQLLNVLKGEMSLVGPRPLNLRDVSRFSEAWLMRRFSVKPGLTCLWQISGRSNVSFERWIALDLQYIDHWSLQLDFRILAMTLPVVIRGTGAA